MPVPSRPSVGFRSLDRRDFLRVLSGAALAPLVPAPSRARAWPADVVPLRIGYVAAEGGPALAALAASARRGAEIGAEEAERSARLFGRSVRLFVLDGLEAAGAGVRARQVDALVGGFDAADCLALAELAGEARIPFLDIGCRADALRGADCRPAAFHVEASDAMYRRALEIAGEVAGGHVALWHSSLERFGASQLNDRFRARFAAGMDGPAWAGWMAMKILLEAWLRAGRASLVAYLAGPRAQFDGHKGWPLSFRASDHQLRQPLYVVVPDAAGGRVGREVPALGAGTAPSSVALDSVAGPSAPSRCGKETR